MVQGRQQRRASVAAASGSRQRRKRAPRGFLRVARYAAHTSHGKNSEPSATFVSSENPHNNPYRHQSRRFSDSVTRSVAHSSRAASKAEREVSQIHSNGNIMAAGSRAQNHDAKAPVDNPPNRLPV